METKFTRQALCASVEQSRGALPSMLSTDAAMADWVADANMRRVDGRFASFVLESHDVQRPAIIAERYWCPSCNADAGEQCRINAPHLQGCSHESRHQVARRAMWRALSRELDIQTGWTVGR